MNKLPLILTAALTLIYPLLVYVGLLHFSAQWVGAAIAVLLLARLLLLKNKAVLSLYPAFALAAGCALISVFLNHAGFLKIIPMIINSVFLAVFAGTLRHPPSMIERFARLQEPELDSIAIAYTRRVTQVWCVFFILNGSMALYTALFTSMATWTLYNGLIAYLLMGLLFAGEYLVRLRVKARKR